MLVDDKFEIDHDGIMAELKKITSQPVTYVINTRHHAHHTGGNARLQAMNATPELVDYSGGGSAKEWTSTLDGALQLDFDTVVPGHGNVTTKQEMRRFRDSTLALRNRVHELIVQKKTRDDMSKMLQTEFHWAELHLSRGLDGIIAENQ